MVFFFIFVFTNCNINQICLIYLEELETQHTELEEKYQQTKSLASTLQTQLAFAQSDTEQCRTEKEKLREEKDAELKSLQEALDKSQKERKESEEKWKKEFEVLRTQTAGKSIPIIYTYVNYFKNNNLPYRSRGKSTKRL